MYDGTGSKHNESESPRVRPYLPSVNIIYYHSSRRRVTMCKQRVKSFLNSRSAKLSLDYLSCDDPLQQTSEHLPPKLLPISWTLNRNVRINIVSLDNVELKWKVNKNSALPLSSFLWQKTKCCIFSMGHSCKPHQLGSFICCNAEHGLVFVFLMWWGMPF